MIRFLLLVLLSQPVLAQVTFTTLGDITFGSDGSTAFKIGNITLINEGSNIGAMTTVQKIGNITFINDGEKSTTVQQLGNISFINQSLVNAIENVTFLGVAPTTDIDGGEVELLFQSE